MVNRASPSPANSNLTLPGELQPHPPRPSLSAIAEREGDERALLVLRDKLRLTLRLPLHSVEREGRAGVAAD
jgi:hypothetical protein